VVPEDPLDLEARQDLEGQHCLAIPAVLAGQQYSRSKVFRRFGTHFQYHENFLVRYPFGLTESMML